ncbi:DUF2790 domain-containing protein [Pseudomonas moraviensis]|uniref:DUF2790 domain-containing protein n=1 Tax=Pseudomonas TaxID=286 RepID=UPI00135D1AB5|nr:MULTISPECIES: DUF2790 domain-containing protein [Pseudomonas]MXI50256.1 DUF2790 domain-containing protein [Pseudomonas moraviensis]WLG64161.1 DUF2790 domain-containing protein [Pseudomonas sp. FP1762]
MTSKKLRQLATAIAASFSLILSSSVLAESDPTTYEYGMKLDIAKIISISTTRSRTCEPVDRMLKYIDSSGKTETLKYRVLSDACDKRHLHHSNGI